MNCVLQMALTRPGTTLDERLARTGLPMHRVDCSHRMAGRVPRPDAQRQAMAHAVKVRETWIFESGFSHNFQHRCELADAPVFFETFIGVHLWRVSWHILHD